MLKSKPIIIIASIIIILIVAYVIFAAVSPMPKLTPTANNIPTMKISAGKISWPSYGQQAIGAKGYGVLATNGEQKSAPIASIAKVILALCILEKKPLAAGEQGPTITISDQDVELFKTNFAQNGSVVPVKLNEQLTEYQALQALLLPSGDNIADTLAIWAFGSVDNFLNYANNDYLTKLNLTKTHMTDASGLSPQTVSSASDLVLIGEKALDEPILADITNQSEVNLPVMGLAKNYNSLLGQDGVIGIKTGNTDEAGGCLLSAVKTNISGKDTIMINAILGAPNLASVLKDTKMFIRNNYNNFQYVTAIKAGDVVGSYNPAWEKQVNVVAKENADILMVNGGDISYKVNLNEINKPTNKGEEVGTVNLELNVGNSSVPVILDNNISKPSLLWKITHPFKIF